jgi:hypothetical protein
MSRLPRAVRRRLGRLVIRAGHRLLWLGWRVYPPLERFEDWRAQWAARRAEDLDDVTLPDAVAVPCPACTKEDERWPRPWTFRTTSKG